jgi:hypothetical protein
MGRDSPQSGVVGGIDSRSVGPAASQSDATNRDHRHEYFEHFTVNTRDRTHACSQRAESTERAK